MSNLTTYELYQAQYPNSTLTSANFTPICNVVSTAITSYLDRNLEEQTYDEYHDGMSDNVVFLKEWPVSKIYGMSTGMAQYGYINLATNDHTLVVENNVASKIFEYVKDLETEGSVDYSGAANVASAISSLQTEISANVASCTSTVDTNYQNVSVKLIKDVTIQQGGDTAIIYVNGVDTKDQINFKLQSERMVVMDRIVGNGVDNIYIRYKAGYTLPSGANAGTLPKDIIDVANRVIDNISKQDVDGLFTSLIKSETLGEASYTLSDSSKIGFVSGLIGLYEDQLARYKRIDIIRV